MKASKKVIPTGEKDPAAKKESSTVDPVIGAVETISGEAGEIGKIRNILFGNQMADYDKRFRKLEKQIVSRVTDLDDKTEKHLQKIETLIKDQGEAFAARLDTEQSERSQDADRLSGEIVAARTELSAAVDALAAQQAKDIDAVNNQLKEASSELSDEIHIQQVEASKKLDQAVAGLDDAKMARSDLSQMLMEMAGRIADLSE